MIDRAAAERRPPAARIDPDVAVIIPAFDAAATIATQIEALSATNHRDGWEIVVVDDACRDETESLSIATAARLDLPLRVVSTGRRSGPSQARNVGVSLTAARLLLFCDADDEVSPGWVDTMVSHLQGARVVTGRLASDAVNDPVMASSRGSGARAPSFLGLYRSVSSGNMGMHREAWDEIGGFDPDLDAIEDAEWAGRAALAGIAVEWAPDAVVHYRFRTAARDLWRQGRRYGRHRPVVARRWWEATGIHAPRLAGLRSWAWLVIHTPDALSRAKRGRWCWVAGNRTGSLVGSLRARFLVL